MFVFASPRGDRLAEPGAVRALRCQLARANAYYGPDPAPESVAAPPALDDAGAARAAARDPWRSYTAERVHAAVAEAVAATAVSGGGGEVAAAAAAGGSGADAAQQGGAAAAAAAAAGAAGAARRPCPRLFKELELVVEPEPEDDGSDLPEVQR